MRKLNIVLPFLLFVLFFPVRSYGFHRTEKQPKNDIHTQNEYVNDLSERDNNDDLELEKKDSKHFNNNKELRDKNLKKENLEEENEDIRNEDGNIKEIKDKNDDFDESSTTEKSEVDNFVKKSIERRSRVAGAVLEIVKVADKAGKIGQEIKIIAQKQNKIQDESEKAVTKVKKRNKFVKFLIGPDYKEIKKVEKQTEKYTQQLKEIEQLKEKTIAQNVISVIDSQIKVMQQVRDDLQNELQKQVTGFSLFGWLNRLLNK